MDRPIPPPKPDGLSSRLRKESKESTCSKSDKTPSTSTLLRRNQPSSEGHWHRRGVLLDNTELEHLSLHESNRDDDLDHQPPDEGVSGPGPNSVFTDNDIYEDVITKDEGIEDQAESNTENAVSKICSSLTRADVKAKTSSQVTSGVYSEYSNDTDSEDDDMDIYGDHGFSSDEFEDYEEYDIYENVDNVNITTQVNLRSSDTLSDKRKQIAVEFLTSEEKYVRRLSLLQKFGWELKTLMTASDIKPDSSKGHSHLFPMMDSIHELHSANFLPNLRNIAIRWSTQSKLSDVFYQGNVYLAPHFLLYLPYVSKLKELGELTKQVKMSSKIRDFITEKESSPEFHKLGIEMHMMEPFQRLPRYKLLLERYLEHVEDESEVLNIKKIIADVDSCNNKIQGKIKQNEADEQMLQLQEQIPDYILIDGSRKFVKQGPVTLYHPKRDRRRKSHLYLFSDMILLTSPKSKYAKKHIIYQHMALTDFKIRPAEVLEGTDIDLDCCLVAKQTSKIRLMLFKSVEEKEEWEDALILTSATCSASVDARASGEKCILSKTEEGLFQEAPEWLPDSSTSMCMRCSGEFNFVKRRHHCRACGTLTCGTCSPYKIRLPYKGYKFGRVCNKCFLKAHLLAPSLLDKKKTADELEAENENTEC